MSLCDRLSLRAAMALFVLGPLPVLLAVLTFLAIWGLETQLEKLAAIGQISSGIAHEIGESDLGGASFTLYFEADPDTTTTSA